MLREAARVVRPGGSVAVFDGDYASWTWSHPDAVLAKTMDEAFVGAIVNNPRVLRDMPRLLRDADLELVDVLANVYSEVGWPVFRRRGRVVRADDQELRFRSG
jgi:hypothetical protein